MKNPQNASSRAGLATLVGKPVPPLVWLLVAPQRPAEGITTNVPKVA